MRSTAFHYHFVSEETFDGYVRDGELLEWARVHGRHRYGTPRGPVEEVLASGRPALLEIDLAGARQVRQATQGTDLEAGFVFLAPRAGTSWSAASSAGAPRPRGASAGWPPRGSSWPPNRSST